MSIDDMVDMLERPDSHTKQSIRSRQLLEQAGAADGAQDTTKSARVALRTLQDLFPDDYRELLRQQKQRSDPSEDDL